MPKTHRKSTPIFMDFGLKMGSQMTSEILQNRPGGHCGPKWHPDGTQRGSKGRSRLPRGPQNGGPGTLRGTIFIIFGSKFGSFSISFTTSFRLCRTMFASISNDINIKKKRRRRDKATNKRMNEQANELTNKRTNERTNERLD